VATGLRTGHESVRAWDLPTRLFHWSLVTLIAASWASYRYSEQIGDARLFWHKWCGYAVLILLVWRLMWGVVGSSTSRFAGFIRGPATALDYARDLVSGRPRQFLGHNPLGALMVLALMAAVGLQASLGLFNVEHNDITAGPLYRLVDEAWHKSIRSWHRWWFYWGILALAAAHVSANVLYGLVKKDPLIPAMVTGRKPRAAYEDAAEADIAPAASLRALVCLVLAAAIVLGGIKLLGGRLY